VAESANSLQGADMTPQLVDLLDELSQADEEVLVLIGKGMLWSKELDMEARALAEKVQAELTVWRAVQKCPEIVCSSG